MSSVPGVTDNKTLLEKADLALANLTTDGGLLQPAQAQRFMRIMINQSKMMGEATVRPMKSHKELIEKIKFGSRILRAGSEATALSAGDRAKPDLSKTELDAKLFKAEVRLDNEVLEDSIEKGQLKQTIMELMSERIALDMDDVLVNGDTTSGNPFFAQLDGVLKQASTNVVDAGITTTNRSIFKNMLRTLPSEFLRNKPKMRFYTSVDSLIDYTDSFGDRATPLGDTASIQNVAVSYSGIPITDIPVFPENLGAGTNETNMLLVDPKNIHVGIWRQIRIETDKLISEGVIIIVVTMRFDVKFAHEPAVVKAIKVKVG